MSTRAIYTFKGYHCEHYGSQGDRFPPCHIYKHGDGYPTGAADAIQAATKFAWEAPRFEADEFAAAFVAANNGGSGDIRIVPWGLAPHQFASDIAYRYEIFPDPAGVVQVTAFKTKWWNDPISETQLWTGPLSEFVRVAETIEGD